ncbi:MAG: DUF1156 domain-containing protein, partial [Rhodobacteraceae bacterium]|nr:DUF1156 domain-containing protein [Paracoccaceae bacterium]
MPKFSKKLIEVSLPLPAISKAGAQFKYHRTGNPSSLHLWWSRKPSPVARAVLFAQMVDDPSSRPDLFPTVDMQNLERERLFKIIKGLVRWDKTGHDDVIHQAQVEINKSWQHACRLNQNDPQAALLYNPDTLPAFHDPFAGGGA